MGEVRALNLWLSLSRCGDEAPGLDLVPRRLEELVQTQTDEARAADPGVAGARPRRPRATRAIVRPIFEPGDALFFDELFLHKTASDPSMPNPRFAIESWFFGGSAFPADYAPVAVRDGASAGLRPLPARPRPLGRLAGAPSAELMLPCLDAAGARSVVEVGAFAGDLTRVLVALGGAARARASSPIDPVAAGRRSWRSPTSTPSSS